MVVQADDVESTSRAGGLYDYLVGSPGAIGAIARCCWEPRGTWKSHKGLRLEMRRRPVTLVGPRLSLPAAFPAAVPPRPPRGPTSKASRTARRMELEQETKQRMAKQLF